MNNVPIIGPFDFLTEQRQKVFRLAVQAANIRQDGELATNGYLYEQINPVSKASGTRGWMVVFISDALKDDPGAKRRLIGILDGIQFDDRYFVHFKKRVLLGIPPNEPRTLAKARRKLEGKQMPLFPDLDPDEEDFVPLGDLKHIVAEYSTDGSGRIIMLRFLDIDYNDSKEVLNELEIDLSIPILPAIPDTVNRPPKSRFVFKPEVDTQVKGNTSS